MPGQFLDQTFPEVNSTLLEFARWRLRWHAPLKFPEPIHMCECRALYALLRHLARSRASQNVEVLVLSDSMVVTLTTDKGRSSDPELNLLMQRCLPYVLGLRLRPRLRWIPSELNTADVGSRAFGKEPRAPRLYERHLCYPNFRSSAPEAQGGKKGFCVEGLRGPQVEPWNYHQKEKLESVVLDFVQYYRHASWAFPKIVRRSSRS